MISTQKQPRCEKNVALKAWVKEVGKSKVTAKKMAAMMLMLINFNSGCVQFYRCSDF